ncbi:MAG: adenylyltransferase/cytidyltransferase family protein [Cyanobacteriota bacterium]|nr:adenylyltransferase/cytidyltransferase family protein [Cyanobacteriota bacterium]
MVDLSSFPIKNLYTLEQLRKAITSDPGAWRPLVLTNGCFDLIHAGHIRYLQQAKSLGKTLVVGLNSDSSVQTIKPAKSGLPTRPIIPQMQRAEVLAALKPVDAVVIFSEPTATQLIETLKPDIYAKGGDYTLETLPETPAVLAYGGQISFIQIEVSASTSTIIDQILQRSAN